MSITVRILRGDGEVINEADFASSDQDCICVDRRGIFRFGPMPAGATPEPRQPSGRGDCDLIQEIGVTVGETGPNGLILREGNGREHRFPVLSVVLIALARYLGSASPPAVGPAGASYLRDMGATLVDKARARYLDAKADQLEKETAAEHAPSPPIGDAPLVAQRWSVEQIKAADGSPAFIVRMLGEGRSVEAQLSGYLAASMCGRLGLIVSELLSEPKRER